MKIDLVTDSFQMQMARPKMDIYVGENKVGKIRIFCNHEGLRKELLKKLSREFE
jgi:hypothetical protein